MPPILRLLCGCAAALALIPAALAQRIVDTAAVEAAQAAGALVWDVRAEEDYRKGHIPGAVNMDDILAQLRDLKTEDYLPVDQIARLLGEAGIDPARPIVLYGVKASTGPYFGAVTLRWLGGDGAMVYHGGMDDWKAAGKPLATEPTRLPAVTLSLTPHRQALVSTDELKARLREPGLQIVDARTAREFSGEDIRALRGGHIPGAVNIPYESTWADPDTPRKLARKQVSNKDGFNLKDPAALRQVFANLDPSRETVVYCQSGVRASVAATVLEELGFTHVRVYDASWLGWGNQLDAPAENVSFFNVGRVNNLLNQLQSRVEDLENQLNALKEGRKP